MFFGLKFADIMIMLIFLPRIVCFGMTVLWKSLEDFS
jgi:hypothetical protein